MISGKPRQEVLLPADPGAANYYLWKDIKNSQFKLGKLPVNQVPHI
jgi:hypothetical protein